MGRHPYIPRLGGPSKEDIDIAEAIIEKTGLYKLKDKYITELSGGEKQRVVFARALVQDTPVLILDEATSNMDIQYTLNFLRAVSKAVSQAGRTVISALHDLNLAATFSNKMVFMKSGRIVSEGDTHGVLTEEGIKAVFNVESRVYFDQYSNSCQVSYKGIGPR
jgi:iron complex transport system ATP-binding protein